MLNELNDHTRTVFDIEAMEDANRVAEGKQGMPAEKMRRKVEEFED